MNKDTYSIRVVVTHLDRASRKAVMKLTQQHTFPHLVKFHLGVLIRAILYRSNRREEFNVPQQELRLTVIYLGVGLGGTHPDAARSRASRTKSQASWLSSPTGQRNHLECLQMNARNPSNCIRHASKSSKPLQVLPSRSASTVALSELFKYQYQ
jgi:hypothetical protein